MFTIWGQSLFNFGQLPLLLLDIWMKVLADPAATLTFLDKKVVLDYFWISTKLWKIVEIKPCRLGSRIEDSISFHLLFVLLVSRTGAVGQRECWVEAPKCAQKMTLVSLWARTLNAKLLWGFFRMNFIYKTNTFFHR